jgi:2-methylcitrate dehydratase PrpD
VLSDPAIDPTAIEPARVKITLKNGQTREAASDTIKGSPQSPMSTDELLAKFRACLAFGLGATRTQSDELARVVSTLESHADAAHAIVDAFPEA